MKNLNLDNHPHGFLSPHISHTPLSSISFNCKMLWVTFKIMLMFLTCVFNLSLFVKIFARPNIQNTFNVSLACLFGFLGFIGPLLVYLYFEILRNWMLGDEVSELANRKFACARFIEVRNMALVAEQIIGNNIIFRFFIIVHAEKGFVSSGVYNSRFLKCCFLIWSGCFALYTYLPWMTASALAENYPENTVKGRICLGLRLDWDKDITKETSDIYIKPRLIVIALVFVSAGNVGYQGLYRTRRFLRGFCLNQNSFASIGGKRRRNILNHQELCICHSLVLFFIFSENILFTIFYFKQDFLGANNVFLVQFLFSSLSDMVLIVLFPALVLYKSLEGYPEIWTFYSPKTLEFYSSKSKLAPRRKQSDYDNKSVDLSSASIEKLRNRKDSFARQSTNQEISDDLPTVIEVLEENEVSEEVEKNRKDQSEEYQMLRGIFKDTSLTAVDI